MSITVSDVAKFALTQTLAYTARNPLEALGATVAISNPRARGIIFEVAVYLGKEQLRQYQFLSRLIYTRAIAPGFQATKTRAITAATTPVVAIPATALAAAAVGAAISAGTVVMINRETNNSGWTSMWSPFGGVGFGTVV